MEGPSESPLGSVELTRPKRDNYGQATEYDEMLKEISHLDANAFAGHLIDNVADEVALEGLDGITIQALKVRLEARPNFKIEGFEDIGSAVWTQIKRSKHFSFYLLPTPRPDLFPYSWDQYRDERGNAYEPLHSPEEIYPYFPVEDKEKGIRGSCEHYHARKDISFIVRRIGYLEAIQLFGNRLVIVATQLLREKALFGANYKRHQGLSIIQFCVMERAGRARYSGEITRGKVSTACMKIPPKTQFYQRKALLKERILLRQNASIKFASCKCPAIVTVFHLPRFYKRIEPIASLNMRTIFAGLNSSEAKCIPVETIVSKYGKHTLRGIQAQFPTLVETAWHHVPKSEEEDDDLEFLEELLEPNPRKKYKPKTVRVLRLKITDLAIQAQIIKKGLEGQSGEDEGGGEAGGGGEPEDREENVNLSSANSYPDIQVLHPPHHYITVSDTYLLYRALLRAGTGGLTLSDLGFLYLTQLEARSTGRILLRNSVCKEGVVKLHKQKAFTYTIKNFAVGCARINMALEEKFMNASSELVRIRVQLEARRFRQTELPPVPDSASLAKQSSDSDKSAAEKSKSSSRVAIRPTALPNSEYVEVTGTVFIPLSEEETVESDLDASRDATSPIRNAKLTGLKTSPKRAKVFTDPTPPRPVSPQKMPTLCLVQSQVDIKPVRNLRDSFASVSTAELRPPSPQEPSIVIPLQTVPNTGATVETNSNPPPQTGTDEQSTSLEEWDDEDVSGPDAKRGDHVDDEIRGRMNRQRVDWNQHDDRFILIAYIASALFIPKCNLTKIFIFNSIQIRDLLLKKLKGKSTKTSPAIRRRIHFLVNQKSYFDSYIGLMGAAIRDEYLYENYLRAYLHPPQLKIYIMPPDEALEAVVNYLYTKFDGNDFVVTDTRTNVNELETILFLRQLKRSELYWNALLFAIFCPMGVRSVERFRFRKMWRKLVGTEGTSNENEAVVEEPQIDTETGSREGYSEIDSLIRLDELGEEKKIPEEYYTEYCFKFFKFITKQLKIVFNNMLMLGSVGSSKEFQLIYFDPRVMSSTAGAGPNLCLSVRECNSDAEIRTWGARCLVIDYVFSGNRSMSLDKAVVDRSKLEKATGLLASARVLVSSKRTGLMGVSRSNLKQFVLGLPSNSYDETLDFLNYIDEASNVDSLACISIGILFGIVELSDYFKSSINVIESVFTLNDEWAPVYDGISQEEDFSRPKSQNKGKKRKLSRDRESTFTSNESQQFKRARLTQEEEEDIEDLIECFEDIERDMFIPRSKNNVGLEEGENYVSSSTNALRLLRIRLNQAGVHMPRKQFTGFVEKDFFTINLPSLEFIFPRRNGLNHRIAGSSHPYAGEDLKELRKALVDLVYHNVPSNNNMNNSSVPFIENHVRKYGILFEIINLAGNVGVSGQFLKRKFERNSLVKGLRYLLDCKLIFSVGVIQRRFVSYNNVNDWVVAVRPRADGNIVGHVILRPWITSLGTISWSTVSRLFTSLLGQLQKPAVAFDDLCESLSPTLSPVEVIVLIEAFAKLKYVTVYKVIEREATMFSGHPTAQSEIVYNAETLLDAENVYVEVSPYTTFSYAQLQHAFQKASKGQSSEEKSESEGHKLTDLTRKRRRRKANKSVQLVDVN